jgi:hypothetical protein
MPPTQTEERYVSEAVELVDRMRAAKVPLRIMAGCGVRIHCPEHTQLHLEKMQRKIMDIDFVTLSKFKKDLEKSLEGLGYTRQLAKFGLDRDIYVNVAKEITVDLFYDSLRMCHVIPFTDRLENDYPTVTLADLALQKLQIVKINEKDIMDLIVLFLEHEVGKTDKETIHGSYIAKLLSADWGFYYTVTENIKKSRESAEDRYKDKLSPEELQLFQERTKQLLDMIDSEPKSMKWKLRQKVGTKSVWYNEVEEKERGTLAEYLMKKAELEN